MRSVHENKTSLIYSLENLSCLCNHEFFENTLDSMKLVWKFEIPLLSRAEIFGKMSHFCWTDLMKCPYYYELIFLQKSCHSKMWPAPIITSWNFCSKIQFWWCHLNFLTGPTITSWKFCKNKAVLMMSFKRAKWNAPGENYPDSLKWRGCFQIILI